MENEIKIIGLKRKKNKYEVITNENNYVFFEDTIMKYYIFKDKVFLKADFETIIDDNQMIDLYQKAIKFISYQSRSRNEVEQYLKEKSDNINHQTQVIDKISSLGYLNDENFAQEVLDYEMRHQKGPKVVSQKLKQKGVSEDVIKEVLSKYDETIEIEIIKNIIDKMIRKNDDLPIKRQKDLLYAKLLGDGFHSSLIMDHLAKASLNDNSEETLMVEIEKLQRRYMNTSEAERKQKIIRSLMNKGYEYRSILSKLKEE